MQPRLRILDDDAEANVPAGPRAPGSVQSLRWFRDPVSFMERARARHGSVFSVRLGALKRCTFISDPELAWPVLSGDPSLVRMGSTNGIFRPVLGERSLFLLDGEEHARHRKLIMPAFHKGTVQRLAGLIAEIAARDLARWPLDEVFPLQERMRSVTLEMIFRAVLGVVEPRREAELRDAVHKLLDMVQNPIAVLPQFQFQLGGRTPFARLMKMVELIDELLYGEIGSRRYASDLGQRDDVLSMLVRAQPHEPGFMGDREVRDELLTLLIAGHETTATALSWTFERLLRHPQAVARLREELERDRSAPYLDAVIREALRQRPVLPVTARKLARPIELGGYVYPRGWTLMPCIYLIHHDPAVFPEPDRFRPERFLGADVPSSRVWLPFGAGPRHCVGAPLSTLTLKTIVTTVILRAELEPEAEDAERIVRRNFTLGPERGARVVLTRRLEPRSATRADRPLGAPPA
jgi:cytochrome P450 family 135